MRKILAIGIAVLMTLIAFTAIMSSTTACTIDMTKDYGDITLSGGFQAGHFGDEWDLTVKDMVISFTYDANGLVDDAGCHAWAELGVREKGYSDFNPTWEVEGAGVWLATDYDWTENTFDPDPEGSPSLDLDDKLILQKGGGCGEGGYWIEDPPDSGNWVLTGGYNLPSIPPNPWANHRVWWDRDGVDPWQNDETANTGGIYNIVITLHATTETSGTAYMNIRSLDQGFETDGNWNTIELTPAGMTFTGDMTQMQVFYGLYGYGMTPEEEPVVHSVDFRDITVTGAKVVTLDDVYELTEDVDHHGIQNSLQASINAAQDALDRGQPDTAVNVLNGFINHVEAQRGKGKVSTELADELIACVHNIIDDLQTA